MTISAARINDSPRGFTLIEIVMVLAIAAVLLGGAVGLMVYSSDERVLREASGEVEILAKRARTIAALHQTPYALEFRQGTILLRPWAEATGNRQTTALGNQIGGTEVVDDSNASARTPVREELTLHSDLKLLLRRWNGTTWLPINEKNTQLWRFDPDGLSEPVTIRYELGNNWAEDIYHPLTASIAEGSLHIQ